MDLPPTLLFLFGLAVILAGAEMVLRTATAAARALGIPPVLIGLTVVAIGTSMPELAVGIAAAAEGRGGLAVGNIAGTNLFNILFILGLSALIRPLPLQLRSIRLDVPAIIVTALVLILLAADGVLSRYDGLLLLVGGAGYTAALVRASRRESAAVRAEFARELGDVAPQARRVPPVTWSFLLLLAGIAATVVGADLLVQGATAIARAHGVSDAFIGLTIVAVGTSAPELATTLLATLRNDRDVAVGNLIGSSVYNVLAILGATCVASPGIPVGARLLWIDLPLGVLVAMVCYPVFRSERRVSRVEGAVFVGAYLLYLGNLLYARA